MYAQWNRAEDYEAMRRDPDPPPFLCLLIGGHQVRALVRPPSSLRKPHVSDTTPNRAFLRGFPATHFWDFGLCRRSRILVAILALCLCIQIFRSRQPGFEHEVGPHCTRNSDFWARRNSGPSAGAAALFRIESERLKLPAPFSRRIAEPFDADATGQATFYCCFDKVGCEKGERDGHIDLPHAALLTSAKLSDRGNST